METQSNSRKPVVITNNPNKPEVVLSPAVKQMIRDWVEEYHTFMSTQSTDLPTITTDETKD